MRANQVLLTALLASAIGTPIEILAEERKLVQKMKRTAAHLRIEGELPCLGGATGWLNSQPLTAAGLRDIGS